MGYTIVNGTKSHHDMQPLLCPLVDGMARIGRRVGGDRMSADVSGSPVAGRGRP